MIDLLIKLLMLLGINYGITKDGQISMSQSSIEMVKSSSEYQKDFGTVSLDDIVVVPNVDPSASENIVVVPNVDPAQIN